MRRREALVPAGHPARRVLEDLFLRVSSLGSSFCALSLVNPRRGTGREVYEYGEESRGPA